MPDVNGRLIRANRRRKRVRFFLPPVRAWFEETFGQPTPPQAQGWPAIQRGEHTLILAPTGSGKTLAAFLWGIDQLFRELTVSDGEVAARRATATAPIETPRRAPRLHLPAEGAEQRHPAQPAACRWPASAARRTSWASTSRRSAWPSAPATRRSASGRPCCASRRTSSITTPESLYLLLTSPKARDMFRTVRTVIVDEIHTLAGNKRGVHLALSLERLQHLAGQPIQRIGLSATIQPLDEVARFLGGSEWQRRRWRVETQRRRRVCSRAGHHRRRRLPQGRSICRS